MKKIDEELTCDDCGTTENVQETICPFAYEIKNKEVPVNLCQKCERERAMDI